MRLFILSALFILTTKLMVAQTTYNMSNTSVSDCEGTLLDSEAGALGATYGNNENFTFVICSGGKITMTFSSTFCIETSDLLRLFNGPDTNSTLIGSYTGTTAPPTIVATSGCLTAHFKSDAIVAYCGWEADWTTEKVPPVPPTMNVSPIPACSSNSIKVVFSKYILCDSVQPSDFTVTGPVSNIVVNNLTSSLNCGSAGDTTNTFTLYLNKTLSQNCDYFVDLDLGLPDNCDSIWHFNLSDTFQIVDCPFTVTVDIDPDTICPGMCADITAIVSGNGPSCLSYTYSWNQGLPPTAGPHTVCISNPTSYNINYNVLVQRVGGGPVVSGSKTLVFVNPEINFPDTTVCQSDTSFVIVVNNNGGTFTGAGIANPTSGLFDPDLAGPGNHYIKYGYPNLCEDSVLIIVKPMDAGLNQAACPGTSPFLVSSFSPSGGTWSGDSITPSGIFNPAVPGTYTLTYSFNGCSESKTITVDSIVLNTPIDTVCQTDAPFSISVTPSGGRWYGTGITDSLLGTFNPLTAGPGTKALTYKLSGCNFNIDITVNSIEAGYNLVVCPADPAFIMYPAGIPTGGSWTGLGITNSSTGLYDPSVAFSGGVGNDTIYYNHPNGCSDFKIVYVRNTIVVKDTVFHCANDPSMELEWVNVGRTPGGGVWTGSGLTNIGSRYFFNPSTAGTGTHLLYYTRGSCYDSIYMVVYPNIIKNAPFNQLYPDTTVCSTHPSWNFPSMPPGGKWVGQGITNKTLGTFNPAVANNGSRYVKYKTSTGCPNDSVKVTVYQFVPAQIIGLDSFYCYKDTFIPFTLKPNNGKLTGPGIDSIRFFNPAHAGIGAHTLSYSFGNGLCSTSTSLDITISDSIETVVETSDDVLCPGESAVIKVLGAGGKEGVNLTYNWNEGLFPTNEQTVTPKTSTLYIVQTSDGCSDNAIDSIFISVAPNIQVDFESSDQLCYGADGYIVAKYQDTLDYQIEWKTSPPQITDSIEGVAGTSYLVKITDLETGCELDTIGKIPSFKNIVASFAVTPNYECIPSDQKTVTFLDLSYNADSGYWDFSGLRTDAYELGVNPEFTFTEAGFFTVTLVVFNEGGCNDEYSVELCVEDIRPVFVADAFTPNGDGVNDVLHVKTQGIKELTFQIFDRWGNLVFETNNVDEGWDGKYRGKDANPGVYIFVVQSKNINNEQNLEKGNVTLIR